MSIKCILVLVIGNNASLVVFFPLNSKKKDGQKWLPHGCLYHKEVNQTPLVAQWLRICLPMHETQV